MMFSSRSLKTKLLILCLWLSAASAAVGICGYVGLNQVVHHYGLVADDSLPKIRLSDDMNLNYRQVRVSLRTLGLPGLTAHDAESAIRTVKESIAKYEESAELYRKMSFHGDEKTRFDKVQSSWTAFKAIGARALELYATGKPEDRAAMVRIFFVECPAAANEYAQAINSLVEFHRENAKIWVDDAHVESDRAVAFMVLAVILGFCFSMGFGFVIANGISNRLKLVSEGIAEGADRVAKAVQQIAEASQELLEGSTQQASALQQTAASVDQTSSMVSKNAENAQRSSDVSTTSQRSAEKGKEAVGQMIRSIEEIAASNDEIMQRIEQGNREISAIVKVISEIGEKTKVINDIVFQTKLLSFNASVEAARAGDMGKGFAVVAEEVGNLAEMSGRASREISGMLEESTKTVEGIVKGLQDRVAELSRVGGEKVKNGATMAKRCGDALDEIVSNVGLVGSLVTEISVASREQAQGVREITDAMGQIDRTAQQNNLASRESSETAEELRSEVGNLRRLVSDLDQTVRGARAA